MMLHFGKVQPEIITSAFTQGFIKADRGMLGSPLLNNDFECIGLVMGANGMDCNNKGPIYFETLANSKSKNTTVYQLLSGGSTTVEQVDGMKLVPCIEIVHLTNPLNLNKIIKASNLIKSSSMISNNKIVTYRAGQLIELLPGFETEGNTFEARIQDCDYESKTVLQKSANLSSVNTIQTNEKIIKSNLQKYNLSNDVVEFFIYPSIVTENNTISIFYNSEISSPVSISLFDYNGKELEILYKRETNKIINEKMILNSNLSSGIYILKLNNQRKLFTSKIIKL